MMVVKMIRMVIKIQVLIAGDEHDESVDYKYDMGNSDGKDYEDNDEDASYGYEDNMIIIVIFMLILTRQ